MNRSLVLAIAALTLWLGGEPARAATEGVDEVDTSFQPAQAEITVGDTVAWTNRSNNMSHAVTIDNGPDLHPTCRQTLLGPVGECQEPGDTARYTFTAAGNYPYRCKLHPSMRGVVVVGPAVTSSSSTSTTLPRATTTSSTVRAGTSSTTATTRPLATSSTLASSSTTSTTSDSSSVLLPGDAPAMGDDTNGSAAGKSGGSDDGSDSRTVVLIVGLLLAASAGGGYLLWRLRPGRARA